MKLPLIYILGLFIFSNQLASQENNTTSSNTDHTETFLSFFSRNYPPNLTQALYKIDRNWQESDEILAIETLYFLKNPDYSYRLLKILEKKTGKSFGYDFNKWYSFIWNKPSTYGSEYFKFKSLLHHSIDPKFYFYFNDREQVSNIRLDEVRWGGVVQDGIPPLRSPKMINAEDATYLEDDNIIFGIEINGEVRAYPKRILAWHEMFTDTIGGVPVAGVYCTLCGTVILYKTYHKGTQYTMGTSGFLYRSNKMMYDKGTQSLWSTHSGKPILGPLINKGIELEYLSVVTTNWKTWKKQHPNTKVLSLKTGHQRDYGEGIAYKKYFASDQLMFNTPTVDKSLKNKDEVLVIKLPLETKIIKGIASTFLKKHTIYTNEIHQKKFTVFTDSGGAHRVFFTENIQFVNYDGISKAFDTLGNEWHIFESEIRSTKTNKKLRRLHSYNAFWFGLKAAFPYIELIN